MSCLARNELALLGLLDGGPMPFPEPGAVPRYAPSWTFRPSAARLHLVVDPRAFTWSGEVAFDLVPLATWDGRARFDLDGPVVHEVTDGQGRALAWRTVHGGIEVVAGEARTVRFAFSGRDARAGLYVTGPTPDAPGRPWMAWTQMQDEDARHVLPCLDHPRVKHPWTITLEGPPDATLLSNGRQIEQSVRDGRAVAVWEQAEPMPAYLLTVVVGALDVVVDAWRDRPVRYLVPRGETDEATIRRAFDRTPAMIDVLTSFTGVPYPWPRYDQVVVHEFVFGGMENTACTTMTDALLVDARTGPHWDPDMLVSHELAHQWFGDLVTCQDWSQGWLNESWATFLETVWIAHRDGPDAAAWYAFGQMGDYLDEDGGRYRRPIVSYLFREPVDVFDRHLYEKGAVVLRTLWWELGDAAFRAATKAYLERHAHGVVHTRDLQRVFEEVTGRNLDAFFDTWVHGAGHPVLRVDLAEVDGAVTIAVSQGQEGPDTPAAFQFGLAIEIVTEAGVVPVVLPVRERERTFVVPVASPVRHVRVDPGFRVLADVGLTGPTGWLRALSVDPCPVLAVRALRALGKAGGTAAEAAVDHALGHHPFFGVRSEAAGLVGKRGTTAARDVLLVALGVEGEPRVVASIVRALGAFRDVAVADAAIARLGRDDDTWHVIGELLETLGRTRDPRAHDVLVRHLDVVTPLEIVRHKALTGLARTERVEALAALDAFSRREVSDRAVFGAARALGGLGDLVAETRPRVRERLLEIALRSGFRARYGAVQALGTLRDPEAVPTLSQLHASDPDGRIRRAAWEALWRIRQGREGADAMKGLRERVESAEAALRELKGRFDRHEGGVP